MRHFINIIAVLCFATLAGCRSTHVVETSWSDEPVDALNSVCEKNCDATVEFKPDARRRPVEAHRLNVRGEILGWSTRKNPIPATAPAHSVTRIQVRENSKGRGAVHGFGIGLAAGGLVGALIGAGSWKPCEQTGFLACFMHPDSRGEAARWGAGAGSILGALAGLVVGGVVGSDHVTIYEHAPGTPHQMKVLIGLSPQTTETGTAYAEP